MYAKMFEAATENSSSNMIRVDGVNKMLFVFNKTGSGTCKLTLKWGVDTETFVVIPNENDENGMVFEISADEQTGQAAVENFGAENVIAVLSEVDGEVSVGLKMRTA